VCKVVALQCASAVGAATYSDSKNVFGGGGVFL
jgi:hypothetical protein